jgi:hypothetical protein
MNTTSMTRVEILTASSVWTTIASLSYKDGNGRNGINRNVDMLEPLVKAINAGLKDIMNKNIKVDGNGEPRKLYVTEADGTVVLNPDGSKMVKGWDWKKDGLQLTNDEQKEYLEEVEEDVPFYRVRQASLSPAWRYTAKPGAQQADREEIFMSATDERAIEYALIMPMYEEPTPEDVEDETAAKKS